MDEIQSYRQRLAENGIEKTPDEATELHEIVDQLFDSLDYESYLFYISRSEDELIEMFVATGVDEHDARDTVPLIVYAAKKKFEKEDA